MKGFLKVGDKITSKKFGRWTIVKIDFDTEFITMVKIRKGQITETFQIRMDHLWS